MAGWWVWGGAALCATRPILPRHARAPVDPTDCPTGGPTDCPTGPGPIRARPNPQPHLRIKTSRRPP